MISIGEFWNWSTDSKTNSFFHHCVKTVATFWQEPMSHLFANF